MKRGSFSGHVLPNFFKVYIPGESGDDLELPISCNSLFQRCLPRTVIVRSIYGKNWKLVWRRCEVDGVERFSLVDGWKRIAADEGLNEGDFLAFEFDGSRSFNFCIFDGSTTCKRTRSSSTANNEVRSESDGEDGVKDPSFNDFNEAEYDDDNVETVDASDDDRKNPSFTRTLTNRISQLRIPTKVIKDYNLNFSECITIDDPHAKKFGKLTKPIRIEPNGSVFVRDFGGVIRRNQVKSADKMIFELKTTGDSLVQTMTVNVIKGQ